MKGSRLLPLISIKNLLSLKMEYIDFEASVSDEDANLNFSSDDEKIMTIDLLSMAAVRLVIKNRTSLENFSIRLEIQQKLFLMKTNRISTPETCSLRCFL